MGQRKLYLQYYLDYCHYMWRRRLIAGILVCLAMYLYRIKSRKRRRAITYAPMIDRDVDRLTRLNRLYHGTEAHCISELRMRKAVFHKLCDELRSRALLEDTFHVAIEEQVAMFIHCVGHHWSNRSIGFEFIRSSETVSKYFHHVLDALCTLARDLICIRSVETHSKITSSPGRFHPYFEGCIGALDGTHIPACVPFYMQDRFRGRKSITSQNVLAAVDFDLRFIYVLAGWEGSAHDSFVLQDALSRPNGLTIPPSKYFLAEPIKFFYEMRELFIGSNADGSLAMDQNTCMDADNGSDSDESRELIDLNCYTQPEDIEGDDSDTLPTPTRHATFSDSTDHFKRKHSRANNSLREEVSKKPRKKSRFVDSTDDITATMKSLRETLAATAPPQMPQLTDPHAILWQKLEAIPMTPDQRVLIGEHLSTKENKGKRGWLCNASADTLHAWVFKFLCDKDGIKL